MKVPTTYAEWVTCLDLLKAGDQDEMIMSVMAQGVLEWQTGVAERFSMQLFSVFDARLKRLVDRLNRDLNAARGDQGIIVQAIMTARREYQKLKQIALLPPIPTDYQQRFLAYIEKSADTVQNSLENSARSDKTGRLMSIVRNNRVNS